MAELATSLMLLGGVYVVALIADVVGQRTQLPRVTILLLAGVLAGPSVLDLAPALRAATFDTVTVIALTFVGFSLGSVFTRDFLRESGGKVLRISISVVGITALLMFFGLWVAGVDIIAAILLAGVATATAPAATRDVVVEAEADGPFARKLLAIVAVDDAWGVLLFSILLAVSSGIAGNAGIGEVLLGGAWELFGAMALGLALGLPLAWIKDRLPKRIELSLALTLGLVLLCAGIALTLHVSYLLATMVMGATVANLARYSDRAFEALERVEWPVLTLFFLLAGASLHLEDIPAVGYLGLGYIVFRIVGRIVGGYLGASWAGEGKHARRWIGPALLPQAGIAIGLGFLAAQRFPEQREVILTVVIGSTVIFELIGPIVARMALRGAGEVGSRNRGRPHLPEDL